MGIRQLGKIWTVIGLVLDNFKNLLPSSLVLGLWPSLTAKLSFRASPLDLGVEATKLASSDDLYGIPHWSLPREPLEKKRECLNI